MGLALSVISPSPAAAQTPPAVHDLAFYYGRAVPFRELGHYDHVVVQPEDVDATTLQALNRRTVAVAYISAGESPVRGNTPPEWSLGINKAWGTRVMDLTNPAWRDRLLEHIAEYHDRGYRAVFLDTLDSYHLFAGTAEAKSAQQAGLRTLIEAIHQRWPELQMILNRGFEVLPQVHDFVAGIVAESLFRRWDNAQGQYEAVPPDDRRWLLDHLREARDRYHLPAVVVDYAPDTQRKQARATARRIAAEGFVPYVTDAGLDMLGVGRIEVVPRRVLALYNANAGPLEMSSVHTLAAPILEYLGYAVDYHDVNQPLPDYVLAGRYAGVVAWFDQAPDDRVNAFEKWLRERVLGRVRLVLMGDPLVESQDVLDTLGIAEQAGSPQGKLTVTHRGPVADGFEATLRPRRLELAPWHSVSGTNTVQFGFKDARGDNWSPVITGPWGGLASNPFLTQPLVDEHSRWLIDPFVFLATALQGDPFPIPDPTTASGRRIMTAHIDGDGFVSHAEFPGSPYTAQVLLDKVLNPYHFPTTVSVIEGEIGPQGLYPKQSPKLESIARAIFALPEVEAASHTYSHPFTWNEKILTKGSGDYGLYGAHLPIPGYKFNVHREIAGSVDYINKRLMPPGKKVRVLLWSGNALPEPDAIALTEKLGLDNVNGGDTKLTPRFPSLTGLSPAIRPTSAGLQVYAPVMNEDVYTNNWTGPYYGYRKVIDTFKLTGAPRRLKPLSIYYHFYSGAKPAALDALRDVYDWCLKQQPIPLWLSEYAAMARGFYRASIARTLDGQWLVTELDGLRTLRLPKALGYPTAGAGSGVAGWRDTDVGRYLSLAGGQADFTMVPQPETNVPTLVDTNARVLRWRPESGSRIGFELSGHEPITLAVRSRTDLPGEAGLRRNRARRAPGRYPDVPFKGGRHR